MLITKIEAGKNQRFRVYGDEQFLFSLYNKELEYYNIQENLEVDDILIFNIIDNIIYKRARERALYLLERRAYSVRMLRDKLYANEYPESVIDQVCSFLKQYNYLNDADYISMYMNSCSGCKSKKQLTYDLSRKGISKEDIELYFQKNVYSEQQSFEKLFQRYLKGKDLADYSTRQKVFRYFYSKGFPISLIECYIKGEEV